MTFEPFRLANGQVCCSDVDALCDVCKSKHAAKQHRSATRSTSTRLAECPTVVDPYANDIAKLRAANLRSEGVIDLPSIRKSSEIHLDANGVPDPYYADVARMRQEYQQ